MPELLTKHFGRPDVYGEILHTDTTRPLNDWENKLQLIGRNISMQWLLLNLTYTVIVGSIELLSLFQPFWSLFQKVASLILTLFSLFWARLWNGLNCVGWWGVTTPQAYSLIDLRWNGLGKLSFRMTNDLWLYTEVHPSWQFRYYADEPYDDCASATYVTYPILRRRSFVLLNNSKQFAITSATELLA